MKYLDVLLSVIAFSFILIALSGTASAGLEKAFNATPTAESKYGTATIVDCGFLSSSCWFGGTGTKVADITLLDNTDYCLNNCYAVGKITLYEKGKLMDSVSFQKFYGAMKLQSIMPSNVMLKTGVKSNFVFDYGPVCKQNGTKYENGTMVVNCKNDIVGNHTDITDIYEPYKGDDLAPGTYTWKIEGKKGSYDNVDWVGNWRGIEVKEWLTWNSTFNQNLQIYWGFDENTGTTVADSVGIDTGTITGEQNWVPGKHGSAFSKTNTAGNNLWFGNRSKTINSVFGGNTTWNNNWTISFWINMTDPPAGDPPAEMMSKSSSGSAPSWALGMNVAGANRYFKLRFRINDANSVVMDTTGSTEQGWFGNWTHVVIMHNASAVSSSGAVGYNIIFNNKSYPWSPGTANLFNSSNNQNLTFAMGNASTTPYFDRAMQFRIDEFAVWDRALSWSEISDLYNSGAGIFWQSSTPTLSVVNSQPANYANISTSSVTFGCNSTSTDGENITTVTLNATNATTKWSQVITGLLTKSYNATFVNATLSDGVFNWSCNALTENTNMTGATWFFTKDTTPPTINITFPLNNTNYSYLVEQMNTTYADMNPYVPANNCKYSTNFGVSYKNFTCNNPVWETAVDGWNYWIYWANDSFGNVAQTYVNFSQHTAPPQIVFTTRTPASGANFTNTTSLFNQVNITEANLTSIIFYLYNSSINTLVYGNDTQPVNYDTPAAGKTSYCGWKVQMLKDMTLYTIEKDAGSGMTVAYVLDSGKSIIQQAPFVGNTATFNPRLDLASGITYYIAGDAGGAAYTCQTKGGAAYPYTRNFTTITGGIDNGADNAGTVYDIHEIVYDNGGSPASPMVLQSIAPIVANVSTATYQINWTDLLPAQYYFNVSATDEPGFENATELRSVGLFGGNPSISLVSIVDNVTTSSLPTNTTFYVTSTSPLLKKCEYWTSDNTTKILYTCNTPWVANFTTEGSGKNLTVLLTDYLNRTSSAMYTVNVYFIVVNANATTPILMGGNSSHYLYVNMTGVGAMAANATLEWNNTNYGLGTKTVIDANNIMFNKTLSVPVYSNLMTTTVPWKWLVTITGSANFTNIPVSGTQQLNQFTFGHCTSTLNYTVLNISFIDEVSLARINGTIDASTWAYTFYNQSNSFTFSNSSNNVNYTFCMYPPYVSAMTVNQTIQYALGAAYPQRTFIGTLGLTNSSVANLFLYLLPVGSGLDSTYQVIRTSDGAVISGADVMAERQIGGVWTTVNVGVTGNDGAVTFFLNPNFQHRITASKEGCTAQQFLITPSSTAYTISMPCNTTGGLSQYVSPIEGITFRKTPASGVLGGGNITFTYYVTSTKNNIAGARMELLSASGTVVASVTNTTCGGASCYLTLMYNVTQDLKGRYSVNTGGGWFILEADARWRYIVTNTSGSQSSLKTFFGRLGDSFNIWGTSPECSSKYKTMATCCAGDPLACATTTTGCRWVPERDCTAFGSNATCEAVTNTGMCYWNSVAVKCYNTGTNGVCIPADRVNKVEYSKIVWFFLVMAILLALLGRFTGYDAANPGWFITLLTGVIIALSISGGVGGEGFFYLDGLTKIHFLNNYAFAGLMLILTAGYWANLWRRMG